MGAQLFLFMLSFIGVMFTPPLLATALIWLLRVDFDALLLQHGLWCSLAFGAHGLFVTFMFFALQDVFFVFRPDQPGPVLDKAALLRNIEESFSRPVDGNTLFEVARSGDRLVITWNGALNYFQGIAGGSVAKKRVVALTFDESTHRAYFVMKSKDARWSASLNAAEFSLNYSEGISVEYSAEVYPSIGYSQEGGLQVELKKLKYDSDELWQPIRQAVLGAGWSLHGGMVPGLWPRLLFSLPMGLLFLGVGWLITLMAQAKQP